MIRHALAEREVTRVDYSGVEDIRMFLHNADEYGIEDDVTG